MHTTTQQLQKNTNAFDIYKTVFIYSLDGCNRTKPKVQYLYYKV